MPGKVTHGFSLGAASLHPSLPEGWSNRRKVWQRLQVTLCKRKQSGESLSSPRRSAARLRLPGRFPTRLPARPGGAWGRGSSRSPSLRGPPLPAGGDKCHRAPSPGEPRSREDVQQAGHAPRDAHRALSHFVLRGMQERNESRVRYFVRLIFQSLFIPHFVLLAHISKYEVQSITIIFSIKFQENEMITRP